MIPPWVQLTVGKQVHQSYSVVHHLLFWNTGRVWNAAGGTRNEIQWKRFALSQLGVDSGRKGRSNCSHLREEPSATIDPSSFVPSMG